MSNSSLTRGAETLTRIRVYSSFLLPPLVAHLTAKARWCDGVVLAIGVVTHGGLTAWCARVKPTSGTGMAFTVAATSTKIGSNSCYSCRDGFAFLLQVDAAMATSFPSVVQVHDWFESVLMLLAVARLIRIFLCSAVPLVLL